MLERTTCSHVLLLEGRQLQKLWYRWLNHSVPMSNETSATLSFSPLRQTTPSSNGQYVCEAIRSGRIVRSTSEGFTVLVMGNG